jgi:tetratricopeptide (TPR) repeat protein
MREALDRSIAVFNVHKVTTVKTPPRFAHRVAAIAAALALAAVPTIAGAQRQQIPGPDTKRVLVTTFRGDVEGGVKAANEIRDRIANEFNIRTLMPTPKRIIDTALANSGYKPDSALSPNDIKELAKIVRGDEVIDGTVQKTATGYRLNARLFLPRDAGLSQPLVTNLETNNLGDAAKQVVSEYDRARKQIPDNQECENGIRNNTPAVAISAARKGIANYPKATIVRLCLGSAYAAMKSTADSAGPWKDSVIAITKVVIDLDKVSRIAYQLQIDAYKSMHDTTNLVPALLGYMASDPTNTTLREQVIAEVIQLGMASRAVPIAKGLVDENPGDPGYLKLNWQVLHAAKSYKEAVAAGVAYVTADTAAADSNYFDRQIADLVSDSAFAKVAEMAASAAAKYPRSTSYLLVKAQNERRAGQLPAAKATLEAALAIDPKVNGANYLLAQIASDMGSAEDAIKFAKKDAEIDAANKGRASTLLLSMGKKTYDVANASKKVEDFKKALPYLQASDEVAPSANAKFLIGVSAYQALAGSGEALRTSHSCDDFKAANELLTLVNINMPAGGSVDANTAKLILGGAAQFGPFIDGSMRRYCR